MIDINTGVIVFPVIDIDKYYAEQTVVTTSDMKALFMYAKFLLSNRSDIELVNWFPELANKLNTIQLTGDIEDYIVQLASFIDKIMLLPNNNYLFVVRCKSDNEIIGFIRFTKQIRFDDCENLEIYLCQSFRNRGIMSEFLDKLIVYFKENEIRNIKAVVNIENKKSQCFLEKNGFRKSDENKAENYLYVRELE